MNIGLFKNATAGTADGTLVDAANPLEDGDLISGQDAEGYWIPVAVRLLSGSYTRPGSFPIQLTGPNAAKWRLAPDGGGGNPGTPQNWGAALTLPGPVTPSNQLFYLQPRVTADEVVEVQTEDLSVKLLIPDDVVTGGVGRSWPLPYAVGGAVGRSWGLPYVNAGALSAVGRSWDLSYVVQQDFSDSFAALSGTDWLTKVSGAGSVGIAGGKAVVSKPAIGDTAHLVGIGAAMPLAHGSAAKSVKAKWDLVRGSGQDWQHGVLTMVRKTAAPAAGDTMNAIGYAPLNVEVYEDAGHVYTTGGDLRYRFWYESGGGRIVWNHTTSAWEASSGAMDSGQLPALPDQTDGTQFVAVIEFHATNGARMRLLSADEATTHATSGWIPWASIGGSGNNYWPAFGGWIYGLTAAFSGQVKVDQINYV